MLKSMEAKSEMTPDESRCRTIERRDLPTIGRAVGFKSAVALGAADPRIFLKIQPQAFGLVRLGSVFW